MAKILSDSRAIRTRESCLIERRCAGANIRMSLVGWGTLDDLQMMHIALTITPRTRQQETEDEASKALGDGAPQLFQVFEGGGVYKRYNHRRYRRQRLTTVSESFGGQDSLHTRQGLTCAVSCRIYQNVVCDETILHKIRDLSPHLRRPFGLSPVAPWKSPFRERASEPLPLCPP